MPQVAAGLNHSTENLLAATAADEPELSPSTLYATACILTRGMRHAYMHVAHCPQVAEGFNDTAENLLAAIAADEPEVSPSTLYATASILEGVPFINGSPQNTFVPGLIELAVQHNVLIGGDDFKSGQVGV